MTTESLRAFANRKGNAVSYWHKQKELGRLVMVDVAGRQMVDVEASEARLASTADPAKSHMADVNERQRAIHRGVEQLPKPAQDVVHGIGSSKNATYMQAKTAREVFDAKSAQLDYEERSGKLISVAAVEKEWAQALTATREHLLQVRARLAPLLANEADPFKIEQLLDAEHNQALQHMAGVQLRASAA
jgi:hypothetical protein